jgi:CRP-like cAMP-binding protein
MAIDQIVASLSRVPLFAGLKPRQISEIGRQAERCAFHRGEVITRAGEAGDGAYLILTGEVGRRTGPGDRAPVEPIEPGSLVGELAMLVDHVYGATVVAQGWADCLKLARGTLLDQMRADPDIAERIADVIRGRLTGIAAELKVIDQLLMGSIERCEQAPRALLLAPPAAEPVATGLAH